MNFHTIPLSLYIHMPWCVKKCPYCDFNSHAQQGKIPEKDYINQLMCDLKTQLSYVQGRPIQSIFIGGGTPSLFSPESYATLFSYLNDELDLPHDIEITLEANPGTIDNAKFKGYCEAGINRISIGVQSFQNNQLKLLGRIHEADDAKNAVIEAQKAGFKKINMDLMFGLPKQTTDDALFDLQKAVKLSTTHLSWYQLTLEPNTYFHRFPPVLPSDDARFEIQTVGQDFLKKNGFAQYEISAYCRDENRCEHNINYWLFGDYLGIGAGAHAKFTNLQTLQVTRRNSIKNPKHYLSATAENIFQSNEVTREDLPLEFMMNALRLFQPIPIALFEKRTGLPFSVIEKQIARALSEELLHIENNCLCVTDRGHLFLNELLEMFM